MFTVGRIGVPIFLMISGFLLLDRDYNENRIKKFWRNNFLPLFICTEIWFLIYDVVSNVCFNTHLSIRIIIEDLLFLHKPPMINTWYMPMILGFYVLIPFVARGVANLNTQTFVYPMLFYYLISFLLPFIVLMNRILMKQPINDPMELQFSEGFSGGCYGLFIIMGLYIKRDGLKKYPSYILLIVSAASFVASILFQLWCYRKNYTYNVWYNFLLVPIIAVCIFELSSRIKHVYCYKLIRIVAKYAFTIYLVHVLLVQMLSQYILINVNIPRVIKVTLTFFISLISSLLIGSLVNKIPKLRKILFNLK